MKTFAFSLMTISLIIFGIAPLFILELSYAREIELVAAWLFDEGSGSTVRDASGNGNDGILKNDPKWTDGKFSKALKFSGGSYVEVEDSDILDLEDEVTVALWFFPTFSGNQAWQTYCHQRFQHHHRLCRNPYLQRMERSPQHPSG